ncbi:MULTISPECIES: O-antigen ligase family protein [Acinetobacter]|uniref:O-antigen ligase-related domain-containing protein n=1 Tax=Acinetobacter higginsii TaxID=70347 RepID=N9SZS9_9GAMM|nr:MULTISPECIES: O-antigen ligase family protein [Acinetobacter]ENX60366.1 hypothetical protein F902_00906 [Acinetobacter higginsii]
MDYFKEKKYYIVSFFYYLYVLFLSFMVDGNSFNSNYNVACWGFYLFLLVLFFYKKTFILYFFSKKLLFFYLFVFFITVSAVITPLDFYQSWVGLFKIYSLFLFGFLTIFLMRENVVNFIVVCNILVFSALIHVFIILRMWFSLLSPMDYDWVGGLYFSNNIRNFTDYMSICFFCSLFLIGFYKKNMFKFFFIIISIFILTFILWSGSRAAYVGVSIGLMFYLYFLKNNYFNFLIFFMIFCSTLISLCFGTNHPSLGIFRAYSQLDNNVDHFSSGRLAIYEKILEYFSYHPILGYGGEAVRQLNIYGRVQAHNSILQILIEFGLVGLVGCIILFYKAFSEFNFKGMPLKEVFIMALLLNVFVSSLFNGGAYYGVILILACFFVMAIYADKNLRIG